MHYLTPSPSLRPFIFRYPFLPSLPVQCSIPPISKPRSKAFHVYPVYFHWLFSKYSKIFVADSKCIYINNHVYSSVCFNQPPEPLMYTLYTSSHFFSQILFKFQMHIHQWLCILICMLQSASRASHVYSVYFLALFFPKFYFKLKMYIYQ